MKTPLNTQFKSFVKRFEAIEREDTQKRFDYFKDLAHWLEDAPRGTASRLSKALGHGQFYVATNVRPIRVFGTTACSNLLFKHHWPWGDVSLLSGANRERRGDLLARALAGDDRKNVLRDVYASFKTGAVSSSKSVKQGFIEALNHASVGQLVKWMADYLKEAPLDRAAKLRKGIAVLSLAPPMPKRG